MLRVRRIAQALICVIGCLMVLQPALAQEKYRVIIMTDMTHDDGNSLIRYLYYSHLFDTEAIIITNQLPDYYHDDPTPWNKGQQILQAYQQEYAQLAKHHTDYPTYQQLADVTKPGRGALPIIWLTNEKKFSGPIGDRHMESEWGDIRFADWIGEGDNPNGESKDSEGSEYLQTVFDEDDDRPIFVQMWGGSITFIQALYRYRQRQGDDKFQKLLSKLHVFGILLQDITFDYLIDLDKVKALDCTRFGTTQSTYNGERFTPRWLLHDGGHFWQYCCPGQPNIKPTLPEEVNGHGPMSNIYDNGGEGDTPSFLYLISATLGLNDPLKPEQGSWGGLFQSMGDDFPEGYYHTCGVDVEQLMRWKDAVKNDFMNRLDYSINEPEEVNHNPVVVVNQDSSHQVMTILAEPGETIGLDASASYDPDREDITFSWFYYPEASSYSQDFSLPQPQSSAQSVSVPTDIGNGEIHIILEVKDTGEPNLLAYRRIILSAE